MKKAGPQARGEAVTAIEKLLQIKDLDERQARKPLEELLKGLKK